MNTNLQNKTFKDSLSLEVQESDLKVNRNGSKVTSAFMVGTKANGNMPQSQISQREISVKTNNSIKQSGLTYPLPNPKDTRPPLIKEEINQLARAWCELLLGQIQEARNQQKLDRAIEAKTIENIDIGYLT